MLAQERADRGGLWRGGRRSREAVMPPPLGSTKNTLLHVVGRGEVGFAQHLGAGSGVVLGVGSKYSVTGPRDE